MTPSPEHGQTVAFLQEFRPGGPWILTAIPPNKGPSIETATFRDPKGVAAWLDSHKDWNLYFHVNPTVRDLTSKAKATDVKELAWLHVDIDPRAGEDLDQERARALKLMRKPSDRGLPPPTVIIDSGGGYQGFWRLDVPVPIDGDEAAAKDAARYNQQIELILGGDQCHNVDRIMRLPGTVNWPNEVKRKKGRVPALAELVEFNDVSYPIEDFVQMPMVAATAPASQAVVIDMDTQKFGSIDALPDAIPAKVKRLILNGDDPDEPYASRSEAQWAVSCALVRVPKITDSQHFAILMDPAFKISESILDLGSRAATYAKRQIERAHDKAVGPEMLALNENHAVIENVGGKCRVLEEVFDHAMKRFKVSLQSPTDFRARYANRFVEVPDGKKPDGTKKTKKVDLGDWWFKHPSRRGFRHMGFAPDREVPDLYNLWRGFGCDARPGDCSKFLGHVKENVCDGNEDHYTYLVGWMANTIQNPGQPGRVAVVLRGREGVGKSVFAATFGRLLGRHFLQVSNPLHLVGNFNSHLADCVVLFADEALYAGNKKHEGILKTIVTEDVIPIERKGMDVEVYANCLHVILASNNEWVIPAGEGRRFFCLDVGVEHREDHGYFQAIAQEQKTGGQEALLHFLKTYDLSAFDVRKQPVTRALQVQKIHSFRPTEAWWYEKLATGRLLEDTAGWPKLVMVPELTADFIRLTRRHSDTERSSATTLGMFLRKFMPGDYPRKAKTANTESVTFKNAEGLDQEIPRPAYYELPTIEECRAVWDAREMGRVGEWAEPETSDVRDPF